MRIALENVESSAQNLEHEDLRFVVGPVPLQVNVRVRSHINHVTLGGRRRQRSILSRTLTSLHAIDPGDGNQGDHEAEDDAARNQGPVLDFPCKPHVPLTSISRSPLTHRWL